jgi:hypothetical protein
VKNRFQRFASKFNLYRRYSSEFEDMMGMDPEMAAMMGFGGFGGGAKPSKK